MRILCKLFPHKFVENKDKCKRTCSRCKREEWLMTNPFPRVGEAKYYWKHMDFEHMFQRRKRRAF